MMGSRSSRFLWCALVAAAVPVGGLRCATFIPGDANSSGAVNITDAVAIFRHLFLGDAALLTCRAAADVDGNVAVDLTDGIRLLSYLFLGGPPPVQVPAAPGCAVQPPDDPLGCDFPLPCTGKGVFLVLNKEGSMNEGTKFRRLQEEAIRKIQGLGDDDQFAIIFYDAGLYKFPVSGVPAQATTDLKAAGIAFIQATVPGHGGCAKPALFQGLNYARLSSSGEKSMFYLSDGFTTCPGFDPTQYGRETLAELQNRNTDRVPIHTICIGPPGSVDENFLRQVAAQNGGTFSRFLQ